MKKIGRFGMLVLILLFIIVIAFLFAQIINFFGIGEQETIAIIPIQGMISLGGEGLLLQNQIVNSETIIEEIQKADSNKNVKGIVFDINSPGGTVVASKELADAIAKVNKPSVALIREVGASGAYWAAASTDKIVANKYSMTGSIGVLGSYLQFSGLMEKYGVTYEQIISGELKDIGNPYAELTDEERNILQRKINIIHQGFLEDIKEKRGLKSLEQIKSGEFYLGSEALELGLVDVLGGKEEAVALVKEMAGIEEEPQLVVYEERESLFDKLNRLSTLTGYSIGLGIGKKLDVEKNFNLVA